METFIKTIVEVFSLYGWPGLIGITILIVCYFLLFKQPKQLDKMGDKISDKMLDAINASAEKQAELIGSVITHQQQETNRMLDYIITGKQEQHNNMIKKCMYDVAQQIDDNIKIIRTLTHADRCALLIFHNGKTTYDDLPFVSYDMKYEWVKQGVQPIQNKIQNKNLSMLLPVIKDTTTKRLVVYTYNDLMNMYDKSSALYDSLVVNLKNETTAFYVLYNKDNIINGIIVIEYLNKKDYEDNFNVKELYQYLGEIEVLLNTTNTSIFKSE